MVSVVPTPLTFFEVGEELFLSDAAEFYESVFSEAPERFDAVDVILTPSELVLVVMNPVMLVTIGYQSVIGLPSVCIDIATREDMPLEDRHQFLLGAVLYDADEDPITSFMESQDGDLTSCSTPYFTPDSAGSKVALIHLDVSG